MFQAYLITCLPTGNRYVGITSRTLAKRWAEHVYNASKRPRDGAIYAAIARHGRESFTIEQICSCRTWADLCAVEPMLIAQWSAAAPSGYNLTHGGEGAFGRKPSRDAVERSAAKHRGKACHPNTRRVSSEFQKGRKRSAETRGKMAAAKRGKARSAETRAKLAAYRADRRISGAFKTVTPYEHSSRSSARKAASAQIAKIPPPLAEHIARVFKPY